MLAHEIQKPKAWAIKDHKNLTMYDFSYDETATYLQLFNIRSFDNILISKFDSYIELLITVKKTPCIKNRRRDINKLNTILEQIEGVNYSSISTSLRKFEKYDCLTAICMLHAVNQ